MFPKYYNNNTLSTTSTSPEGCHVLTFIRQNEVNEANELLKVQQPLLECPSEMDKLRCITNTAHSPVTKTTVIFLLENFELSRVSSD